MKIKYNGQLENADTGCIPCGAKRKGKHRFVTSKEFILPSGQTKTFHLNEVADVSARDGSFLLEYNYKDANGLQRAVFEEVK